MAAGGSRPSDKLRGGGGGGQPDPAIREEAVAKKYIFPPLRASVWSKNKGEARAPQTPPLDPPLSLWYTKLVHRTKCVSHKAFLKVLSWISDLLIYCNYIRFIMFRPLFVPKHVHEIPTRIFYSPYENLGSIFPLVNDK